jgi:hypothetical protein
MSSKDVSTPTDIQSAMVAEARPIRTLVAGTNAMRAAGEEYLPKEPMESLNAYTVRKKRSWLFNATGKTVEDMTGKVFAKPIIFDKIGDADLKQWFENVDNAGRHVNVFAKDAFYDAIQPGIGFIYVDMPPAVQREDGRPATIADEQKAGIRPYMKFVPLESLIGWKTAVVAGKETLTQIRIKECATEPDPENPYQDKDVEQIRVVSRVDGIGDCTWETYRVTEVDGRKKWIAHERGTLRNMPEIPIFPIYMKRSDFMRACPPLAKLAELNIAHWQSSSDQRNILKIARVPVLFAAGFGEQDKFVIGASEAVQTTNPQAKLEYVEHSGAAIESGDKDLRNLELQMQAMGLQLLIDKPGQSATGEVRDDAKENSPLAMMATGLQDALTQAAQAMARFAGKPEPKAGDIVVNKDFGMSGNTGDFQYLTQARLAGKLDNETWINEGKRRGVFQDTVDPETVQARIEDEAPELDAGAGNGMDLGNGPTE